jgi:hypothetical protein
LYTRNNYAQSHVIDNILDVIGAKKKNPTGEN